MSESSDVPTAEERSSYLLDGRRVRVSDLLAAGLLAPGASLVFRRTKTGVAHRAEVLATGQLRLADGRTWSSPSRAAAMAAEVRALDGWHAWVEEDTGRSIDSLRQELLDNVAAGEGDGQTGDSAVDVVQLKPRHEQLKEFRAKAEAGEPVQMTVRELLAMWKARARGYRVSSLIETDLANHGLRTSPHWQKVTLDANVQLQPLTTDKAEVDEGSGIEAGDAGGDDPDELDVGLTVGNLPSAMGGVCCVSPSASLNEAVTLMLINDFSQLPVLAGPRSLKGAVTWRSIARARHANPNAGLREATVRADYVSYDRELIDVLPTLYASEFVFVRDQTTAFCGIVTASDVVSAYGELVTPFLLIGELDQLLRRVISQAFPLDDVRSLCDPEGSRQLQSFDDLTVGDYQQVLQNPAKWTQVGWPLDRAVFCRRLDELREVRNDVMHFNPDPTPPDTIAKLRGLIGLVRQYGDT